MRKRVGRTAVSWVARSWPERRESQSKRASICSAVKTGRTGPSAVSVRSSTPERRRVPAKERCPDLTVTFPPRTLERRLPARREMRLGLVTYQTPKTRRRRTASMPKEVRRRKGETKVAMGAREAFPQERLFHQRAGLPRA